MHPLMQLSEYPGKIVLLDIDASKLYYFTSQSAESAGPWIPGYLQTIVIIIKLMSSTSTKVWT